MRIARQGLAGPVAGLPHLPVLQQAFGPGLDPGRVRAYSGAVAAEACERLNANAYAVGEQIAFRPNPSLHTVAHEITHVLQHRAGMTGSDAALERQADQVADHVVRGGAVHVNTAAAGRVAASPAVHRQAADQINGYPYNAPVNQDYQLILAEQLAAQAHVAGRQTGNRGGNAYGDLFESARAFAAAVSAEMQRQRNTGIPLTAGP